METSEKEKVRAIKIKRFIKLSIIQNMEKIIKIGKHIYLSGLYQMRSVESNYANPCEFPTIFVAF